MVSFAQVIWPALILRKWLLPHKPKPLPSRTDEQHDNTCDCSSNLQGGSTLRRGQSETLRTDYTRPREYKVFVGTWNVGGMSAPDDLELEEWLCRNKSCDIYVIGFQESVPLKAGKVLGSEDSRAADKWDALIDKALNRAPKAHLNRAPKAPPSHSGKTQFDFQFQADNLGLVDFGWSSCKDDTAQPNVGLLPTEINLEGMADPVEKGKWGSGRQRYERIVCKQMVGLYVTIWVSCPLVPFVRDIRVSCVGCGIMGYLRNKGSISISLRLHQSNLCFVCVHLASGHKEGDEARRNSDVAEILKRTIFSRSSSILSPRTIMGHDGIIWFGDLNYRIALCDEKARHLIEKTDWTTLQWSDELKTEQKAGRVFQQWKEGTINFAPTYKYAPNSDHYSGTQIKAGGKRRVPAWCDRILWYGNGLEQISYERAEYKLSDHRPVSAIFTSTVDALCKRKVEKSVSLSIKLMEAQNLLSPDIVKLPTLFKQSCQDDIGAAVKAETNPRKEEFDEDKIYL
ncbi:hypothetical protein SUGI_0263990 [Cryptomeria japonica]|nr:hypothetical protein SUGI_0263990 [Cryptomeria japonica]